jgi:hypothetical protein
MDYHSKMISLGSCFAENMGDKFQYFKFQNTTNPFGIIFNPVSIEKIISKVVRRELFSEEELFFHNERWHSFDIHSDLSNANKEELLANLNTIILSFYNSITEASHIIITYGTSWVYRNLETNTIVANCHKVPQKQFKKELLSTEEIQRSIENSVRLIRTINPNVNFIFTVSPVRHLKDGFVENQVSKANLITAIYSIHHSPFAIHHYFPSYEIMMDELRDYRFYAEDMIHPNSIAIDYIWQRFSETHISAESYSIMDEVETIQKGLAHRPFNPNSESHLQFLSKLQDKMARLQLNFSSIKF